MKSMNNPNKQVFLPCVGEKLNILLTTMVADHGKAGNTVGFPVIVQNIRESPVHLVRFTGFCSVPVTTVSLGRNQLAFSRQE